MTQEHKIRNIRAFVKAHLKTNSGQAALARRPIRVKTPEGIKDVWRSSAMAEAFQSAVV